MVRSKTKRFVKIDWDTKKQNECIIAILKDLGNESETARNVISKIETNEWKILEFNFKYDSIIYFIDENHNFQIMIDYEIWDKNTL